MGCVVRVFLLAALFFSSVTSLGGDLATKHVLLLYSNVLGLPAHLKNSNAFLATMQKAGVPATNVHFEFLDLVRDTSPAYRTALPKWLQLKYDKVEMSAIVTVDGAAQQFVLNEGGELFPDAPLISVLAPQKIVRPDPRRKTIQIMAVPDFTGGLEIAHKLFPEKTRIMYVIGASEDEKGFIEQAEKALATFEHLFKLEFTNETTHEELLERIKRLTPDTLLFHVSYYRDRTGAVFVPKLVADEVVAASPVPVFTIYDGLLGIGVLGGSLFSYESEGVRAAEIVIDIMAKKRAVEKPLTVLPAAHRPMFDWKEVIRWGLSEQLFPKDAFFLNKPPSLWPKYKVEIISVACVGLLQLLLIVALVLERSMRRRAVDALQRSEADLRSLLEHAPDAICVVDGETGRFTSVNRRAESLFGLPQSELVGKTPMDFYSREQPDGLEVGASFAKNLREVFEVGHSHFERILRLPDGSERVCEVNLALLYSASGKRIRASFLDITERRRAEQAKALFLASVSHELRTPLNAIIGAAELMLLDNEIHPKTREFVQTVDVSATHLLGIVGNLLSLSKSEAEMIRMENTEFLLSEILAESTAMIRPLLRSSVAFHDTIEGCDVWVRGDRAKLLQILLNVLGNAAKFTEKGEVNVSFVGRMSAEDACELVVTVEDTGVGIKKSFLSNLFVPFKQQDESLSRRFQGSGLGLAITKKILQAMNGEIEIVSEENKGTRVVMTLRFAKATK